MKKPRVAIEGHHLDKDYPYDLCGVHYALVSSPKNGRKQCIKFLSCRDYIHEAVRAHVQNNDNLSYYYTPGEDSPIDMEKLRLLIADDTIGRDIRDNLFNAKKIINFYEGVAGWSKSKITTVTHDLRENVWLLTGPKEWMSYPNLLSMVTLILRIGAVYGPIEFKDNKTLEKAYKKLIDEHGTGNEYYDITYLERCYKKFYLIMKHNKKLFTLPLEEVYPPDGVCSFFHGKGGIVSMCRFEAASGELNRRFEELLRIKGEEEEKDVQKQFYDRHGS